MNSSSPSRRVHWLIGGSVILLVLIGGGLWSRASAEHRLENATQADAVPHVAVVTPKLSAAGEELVLPASVQPFVDAPIYARTNGYLKRWYFDIGAHVRQGQLLAEIETPEVDQQLAQAQADLKVAQANAALAASTAVRWQALLKKNAVSQQETDQMVSDYSAKRAAVDAARANVARLEQLQEFEKVYAPFDGVITARDTDIGALIASGSSPKELFHLAAVNKLRVFAAVPEVSAGAIQPGGAATLTTDQFPDRIFRGTIARDSGAIDPSTRTLTVEVDIDNRAGLLMPGAYGYVHLLAPERNASITVPANTLLFRAQGLQASIVRDGKAEVVPITIGRDFGDTVEVTAGLHPHDLVILDPPDSIISGDPVIAERTTSAQ